VPADSTSTTRRSPRQVAHLVATVLAIVAALVVALAPLGVETSMSGSGEEVVRRVSFVESQGAWVLGPCAVPVGLAAAPVMLRDSRAIAILTAGLLLVFVLVSLASFGLFFLPAALAAVTAAALPDRRRRR